MKTKRRCRLMLVILSVGLLFACKKNPATGFNDNAVFSANVEAQAYDQLRISNTIDAVFNDVDSALANPANLCGASVTVDSVDSPRVISIAYNGISCGFVQYLKGVVTIQFIPNSNWNSALDTVVVTFNNVIINTPPDTSSILFNGGCYYTNVTGGSLSGLTSGGPPIVHTITGVNLSLIYNYFWPSVWQIARQRTYTNTNGLTVTTSGMDSAGGIAAVSEWGGNRWGNSVFASIDSPLVISQGCGWRLTTGKIQVSNPAGVTNVAYGLDSTGAATGCPAAGTPYYYKLAWSGAGQNPYNTLLPYP
jgi:hypothetical protein